MNQVDEGCIKIAGQTEPSDTTLTLTIFGLKLKNWQ